MEKENIIQVKSYQFALAIIELVRKFPRRTDGYVLGNQLLRASTSIGANVEEAIGAFSKNDFSHKMSIALKEARESNYWLRLIRDSHLVEAADLKNLPEDSEELRKILTSIVKSAQKSNS